ncbi:MAG TPA: adenylate/guanylate cyclase domain-containing protein [Stellaceae bacterium]|nr:adenylate/guanylate cyclase domain-containing protein [Stellaceae bacterium]
MDVASWLSELGLECYAAAFAANDVTANVLPHLSADDLKELGVNSVGHRRLLLAAIAGLREGTTNDEGAAAKTSGSSSPLSLLGVDEGERRHLTVMFCDIVDSTALAGKLDPEDMRVITQAFYKACAESIRAYEGFVAKYLGDGVLAYFGYPRAHEDDPERAARAALELTAAIRRIETPAAVTLHVRVGIATGLVVVGELIGEGAAQERFVTGETPSLAARLQTLAEPDTIVVSDATRHLLSSDIRVSHLGKFDLKGFSGGVNAWRIDEATTAESRFERRRTKDLAQFVGREEERNLLLDRQELAWQGSGQVVLVSGEAGIGKSRLAAWLTEQLPAGSYKRLFFQCSPYHKDSALHPFIVQLKGEAGFEPNDPIERRLEKLARLVADNIPDHEMALSLLAALLSLDLPGRQPVPELSPIQQRRETLRLLLERFVGLSRQKPLLLIFEDAQWADATSLELLELIAGRIARMRVLAVITHRPDFAPHWHMGTEVSRVGLDRLDRRHAQMIVQRMASDRPLPEEILTQVIARTDGIPLFIEELVKSVLESGLLVETVGGFRLNGSLPPFAIPATLKDSLMERLDRMAPVRGVAQVGAAIGREFSFSLISAVAEIDADKLAAALGQLEDAELVVRRGTPPNAIYAFKHALVQDTAYESLLKSRRQRLHQRIAQTLCEKFAEQAETEPEVTAHHFTEAGLIDPAVAWWGKAGRRAMSRLANFEAVQSFARGLDLIAALPDGEERDRRELPFRLWLGLPLLATRGYASTEVERNYEAASALAERLGDREARFTSERGLWNCVYDRGALNRSAVLSRRLLDLAEADADPVKLALAWRAHGSSLMSKAELVAAETAFDKCIALSDGFLPESCIERYGEAPQVVAYLYKGFAQCVRGSCDRALENARHALALAKRIKHPLSEAFASCLVAVISFLRRDYEACEELSRKQVEFSIEHGFVFWHAAHQITRGASAANLFHRHADAAEVKAGIDNWRKTDALLHIPTWSSFLADAALACGNLRLADEALSDGIVTAQENSDLLALADLQRLKGLLLLKENRREEARRALVEAIETSRHQGAGLYHLRSARDLARLLGEDDRRLAIELLAPVVERFAEHRGGLDYRQSAELLLELRSIHARQATE